MASIVCLQDVIVILTDVNLTPGSDALHKCTKDGLIFYDGENSMSNNATLGTLCGSTNSGQTLVGSTTKSNVVAVVFYTDDDAPAANTPGFTLTWHANPKGECRIL